MDWSSLSLAAVASSTSGVNLYATVLTLGLMQRFQWLELPTEWQVLGQTWVIVLAGALFLIEFVADKIPYVDSLWDGIHTFIRVPAGAVLMASAFADVAPSAKLAAGLFGGSLALTTHSAKATARLAANTSPEPFSNIVLSVIEDVAAVFLLGIAASHPIAASVLLMIAFCFCCLVLYTCFKFTRMFVAKLSSWFRRKPAQPSTVQTH